MQRIQRVRLSLLVCSLLAVMGLGWAQETPPPPEPNGIQIQVGNVPVGEYGARWLQEQVRTFQEAHPGVQVTTFGIGSSRHARPLSSLPDLAENVVGYESMTGGELCFLADRDLIVPLDKFLPDPEFELEVFDEGLRNAARYKGKTWAMPWYAEQPFLICNWPLFEEAGIKTAPKTWDQFLESIQRLGKDTNGDGRYDQWGFEINDSNQLCLIWLSMLLQQGVPVLDADGFHVDSPEARQAFEWVQRLVALPMVKIGRLGVGETAAMAIDTTKNVIRRMDQFENKDDMTLAYLPTAGKNVSMASRLLYLCVRKSTPEREKASWELLKWIARKDVPLPGDETYGFFCRKDVVDRPDFKDWAQGKCRNVDIAFRSAAWPIDPAPLLEGKLDALLFLRNSLNDAWQGKTTYDTGVIPAMEQAKAALKPHKDTENTFELFR